MTTINRKRARLVEKLRALEGNLLVIHPAYKGIIDDSVQVEVSRETLIELLTSDKVQKASPSGNPCGEITLQRDYQTALHNLHAANNECDNLKLELARLQNLEQP